MARHNKESSYKTILVLFVESDFYIFDVIILVKCE